MSHRLTYLPQLDGLRALAVLMVVLYHSNNDWIPGGFVGVDVFFFLSGFLITQIVTKSLETGSYSYLNFIAGRVRRLFPAYLAMVTGCLLVAPLILLPGEFERLSESAIASISFLSNVFFYQNLGYFDAAAEQQLLLHTWSLSVEWQFYLVFPIVLWASSRFINRIVPTLILVSIASFAFCALYTPEDSKFAFFMLPARVWKLTLGGLMGLAYMNGRIPVRPGMACSLVGVLLLCYAIFFFDRDTLFPGVAVAIPVLGTALVVANSVFVPGGLLARFLSSRPLVKMGQMSYSLYLWHWPVLLYARFYVGEELTLLQIVICWILTAGLAYVSWRWIESFLKGNRILSGKWRPYIALVLVSVPIVATAGLVIINDGYDQRPAIRPDTAARSFREVAEFWSL